jgi:hypothetical protein
LKTSGICNPRSVLAFDVKIETFSVPQEYKSC